MTKKYRDLSEGNIKKQIYSLTWPMVLGMLGMVIFNLVDTFFIGKLGVKELAAIGFSFPVIMFVNSLAQGVGIGTGSLIARNIIHADHKQIKTMSTSAILLGIIIVLFFIIAGVLTIRPLFSALGAENNVLDYIYDYMSIWYFGVIFVVIPMIGNNIVRATGDTFTPGMLMVVTSIANAILDPLFIFGYGPFPQMGIKGAAFATVFARSIALIFILIVLLKREKLLTVHLESLRSILATWKDIIYIAGPSSLSMLIIPVSTAIITKIVATFGKEAVAALGVASKIEMFILMIVIALGTVVMIFTGQNLSKHKFQRIFKALNISTKFSIIWGIFIFIILLFFGNIIASLFTHDQQVIKITMKYFYIIGASYAFQGLIMLSSSAFNGLNKPYPTTVFAVIRTFILYIPLAWIGSKIFNINGVFWAGFISNIIIGIFSLKYLYKTIRKIEPDI
ncbi:MAG: MATE family efflux transporter [Spirochaetes bacterium]|nr:MATE family efflux transporter [Spirochaetota bacterium]